MNADVRRRRFNSLMAKHALTSEKVGILLGRHPVHVRHWMSGRHPIPAPMLRLLELELQQPCAVGAHR
jgi:hypothetical protein